MHAILNIINDASMKSKTVMTSISIINEVIDNYLAIGVLLSTHTAIPIFKINDVLISYITYGYYDDDCLLIYSKDKEQLIKTIYDEINSPDLKLSMFSNN